MARLRALAESDRSSHPANRELELVDVEIISAPVPADSDMVIAGAKAFLKSCGKTLDDLEECS